jgi:hypothetical protein
MKKPIIIIIVLIILGTVVWTLGDKKVPESTSTDGLPTTSSAPVTETTKLSDKLSEYKNEELGFSVKYPSTWDAGSADTGIIFVIPTAKAGSNTVRKLEAKISVISGKCSFPPVTTVKDRTTLKNGDLTFNTISMSNSVQGNNYFDRMYSLQKDSICYILSYSSITSSPASKGFKGSEATQVTNNNKAILDSADQAFVTMVKSFAYVVGAVGKDEAQVVPTKK